MESTLSRGKPLTTYDPELRRTFRRMQILGYEIIQLERVQGDGSGVKPSEVVNVPVRGHDGHLVENAEKVHNQ